MLETFKKLWEKPGLRYSAGQMLVLAFSSPIGAAGAALALAVGSAMEYAGLKNPTKAPSQQATLKINGAFLLGAAALSFAVAAATGGLSIPLMLGLGVSTFFSIGNYLKAEEIEAAGKGRKSSSLISRLQAGISGLQKSDNPGLRILGNIARPEMFIGLGALCACALSGQGAASLLQWASVGTSGALGVYAVAMTSMANKPGETPHFPQSISDPGKARLAFLAINVISVGMALSLMVTAPHVAAALIAGNALLGAGNHRVFKITEGIHARAVQAKQAAKSTAADTIQPAGPSVAPKPELQRGPAPDVTAAFKSPQEASVQSGTPASSPRVVRVPQFN